MSKRKHRTSEQIDDDIKRQTKCCTKCGVVQPFQNFHSNKTTRDTKSTVCRICNKSPNVKDEDRKNHRNQYEIDQDIQTDSKICNTCNIRKSFKHFSYNQSSKDYRWYKCKKCDNLYRKQRYKSHPNPNIRTDEEVLRDTNLGSKKCRICGERKDFDCFWVSSNNVDNISSTCKCCLSKNRKKWPSYIELQTKRKKDPLCKLKHNLSTSLRYNLKRIGICKNNIPTFKLLGFTNEEFNVHFLKYHLVIQEQV